METFFPSTGVMSTLPPVQGGIQALYVTPVNATGIPHSNVLHAELDMVRKTVRPLVSVEAP